MTETLNPTRDDFAALLDERHAGLRGPRVDYRAVRRSVQPCGRPS